MCMCMRMRMCICYVATRPHVHSPCHKPRAPVLRSQTSTSEKIVTNVANGSQKAPATIGYGGCSRAYPACNRTSPAMSNILVNAPSFMRARGVADRAGHSARCTSGCASHSGDSSLHSPWGVQAHAHAHAHAQACTCHAHAHAHAHE